MKEGFKLDAKTGDNVTIVLDVPAQYHVDCTQGDVVQESGIYRSYYMLAQPIEQMHDYLADALRSSIPNYTLDEVFEEKDNIANDVNDTVSHTMASFGWTLVFTLITGIQLPQAVEQSMNGINAAHGIAVQRIAIVKGIKESLDAITGSNISETEANELFLYTQWVEIMTEFAKSGQASTVVLPADFEQSCSMFDQMLAAAKAPSSRPEGEMTQQTGETSQPAGGTPPQAPSPTGTTTFGV